MEKGKLLRMVSQILLAFFVSFSLEVLFTFFRGDDINVPEELIDSAVFCVIYFAFTFYSQYRKKAKNVDDNANKAK